MSSIAAIAGRIPRPHYADSEYELAEYRRRIMELGGRPAEQKVDGAWGRRTSVRQGYVFPDGSFLAF